MSMTDILVTPAAQAALEALSEEQGQAVRAAISDLGTRRGEPLNIPPAPAAPPDTPFLALKTSLPDAPIVVYRRTTPDEPGDWLVVALLSREEYRRVRLAGEMMSADPAARETFSAVVAGTVPTTDVTVHAGTPTVTPTGGSVPTTGPGAALKR